MHLHEKLDITFQELMALFAVRTMLQHGLITFQREYDDNTEPGEHAFNMNVACSKSGCGTIGCIGGYMGFVMGRDGSEYINSKSVLEGFQTIKDPIYELFYPPNTLDWDTIEPHHAVQAIDNFLKDGDPCWEAIDGVEDREYR